MSKQLDVLNRALCNTHRLLLRQSARMRVAPSAGERAYLFTSITRLRAQQRRLRAGRRELLQRGRFTTAERTSGLASAV